MFLRMAFVAKTFDNMPSLKAWSKAYPGDIYTVNNHQSNYVCELRDVIVSRVLMLIRRYPKGPQCLPCCAPD